MDTALATTTETERRCVRCGGFMVGEFSLNLLNGNGKAEFLARCVQCGEVVDPVILKNRRMQRPSSHPQASSRQAPNS